jgi:hypothetical protein
MKDPTAAPNGRLLDLLVEVDGLPGAALPYVPANPTLNGISGQDANSFGVINVKSPNTDNLWHSDITFVQLRFTLIDTVTGAPLDTTGGFETWITFYDFDGAAGPRELECGSAIPIGGGNIVAYSEDPALGGTSLAIRTMQDMDALIAADTSYAANQRPPTDPSNPWYSARVFCAQDVGIGKDNPQDPISLVEVQRRRSVYTQITDTSTVLTRVFVAGCCGNTGRNFLFGGRPRLEPCQSPPPPPPPVPVAVVVVEFDPHLSFAHGGKADFRGKDRTWYNLLSAKNVSVNAFFTADDFKVLKPRKQLVHGSRMEQMCMTVRTDAGRVLTIEYNATDKFPFVALVHQRSEPSKHIAYLTTDKKHARTLEVDNIKLSLRVKKIGVLASAGHGTTLVISTGKWEVFATSKAFPNPRAHPGKSLLNINLHALYDADHDVVAPHGLIGQSYDGDSLKVDGQLDDYTVDEVTTQAMAEGAIEGVATDYEMPSRFATAFKYSRFDAVRASPRDISTLSGKKSSASASPTSVLGASADVEDEDSKVVVDAPDM